MSAVATRTDVPEGAVADFSPDYSDCFRVASLPGTTAADWARASLRGAEGPFSRVVWQGILGFDLASSGTPGTLVGWPIRHDSPERFVMAAGGRLMVGRRVFEVVGDSVRWTTTLRFHGMVGRTVWAGAGPAHRRLAPRCLDHAHRLLARRDQSR
jgi:hypothetical protein